MKLDIGRRCRLLDLKDACYINGRLDSERVKIFYRKIEEYKQEDFEVTVYEIVAENMMNKLEGILSEVQHD